MTAKEKFTKLISKTEELVNQPHYQKPAEIKEKLSMYLGLGNRDLNTIFTFLTSYSLIEYIRERQIMAAYSTIISMPIFDIEVAISVSGYDNQSSFGKKFKERFGLTPKEAFNEKDFSRIAEQITWDIVSNGVKLLDDQRIIKESKGKTKFGIPSKDYKLIQEATDLQALFEFDDLQSNIAFNISKEWRVPLRKAYDFVDDYSVYLDYIPKAKTTSEDKLSIIFDNSDVIARFYFNVTNEIGTVINLIGELKQLGYNPNKIDIKLMQYFVDQNLFGLKTFLELAQFYIENEGNLEYGDGFLNFLNRVFDGVPLEDALYEEEFFDEPLVLNSNYCEEEYNESFEKWAEEETDYRKDDRITDDYDEDSAYYDDGVDNSNNGIYFSDEYMDKLFDDENE